MSRSRLARSARLLPSLGLFRSLCLLRLLLPSKSSSSNTLPVSRGGLFDNGEGPGGEFSPERLKPNIRRRGLIGGTGGATSSRPFFRLAPGGRATVSTDDVVEMSVGSPISYFWMERFRAVVRSDVEDCGSWLGKLGWTGVLDPDIGGVIFAANEFWGEIGE
jgi:hypothetical protein